MRPQSADDSLLFDCGPTFAEHVAARRPMTFRHSFHTHPALEQEAIARLTESLDDEWIVCEDAVKPLVYSEYRRHETHSERAADIVRHLEENESWLTLLNIEQNPLYLALIDEQVDRLARRAGINPRSLRRRMGFIFASSPGSVTGAHFDIEHSLLLQLRGNRTLTLGDFPDEETRDSEIRRYWNGSFGRLNTMPVTATEISLGPGDGLYIPPYRPHWLLNGSAPSLSMTITFFNRSNERESLVQAFNERVRKFGLDPRPQGQSALRDNAKVALMRTYSAARKPFRRSTGTPR